MGRRLSETRQDFSPVLEGGSLGLWHWDVETDHVHFSPEWKRQLGFKDHELEDRLEEWEDRLHPEDRHSAIDILRGLLDGRPGCQLQYRLRHKDGTYRKMLAAVFRQTGTGGKLCRLGLYQFDITGREGPSGTEICELVVREQAALAEADFARYQLGRVLDRVSDGFVAIDRDWRYVYINQPAAELLGRRPDDLIGKNVWTVFPEGLGQPFHDAYKRAMEECIPIEMESYFEPWNRWFENRIYPSADGLSIFFHDITERKRAEQAARESAQVLSGQSRVLELIARGTPLHETLKELLRVIQAQSPETVGAIQLLDEEGTRLRHSAAPGLPWELVRAIDGQPIGPRAGSFGAAAFRREPVNVEDIATDPLWDEFRDLALRHGLRACWSIPIFDARTSLLGTFSLYLRNPGGPSLRHQLLMEMAVHTASIAIVTDFENQALRAGEERLRLAVTGGNVGIWEWHVGGSRLVWSQELKDMFGWSAGEPTFTRFMEAVHPEDRTRVAAAIRRSLSHHADFDVEYRILRDSEVRWIGAKGRATYDAEGRPVRMRGVALDITERKCAEQALKRREAQLAEAQQIAHIGSYEWDLRTNVVHRSEELCNIYGVACEEFKPTFEGYLERLHPEDRERMRAGIEEARRKRRPYSLEQRAVRPDGSIRVLLSQGKWICDAKQIPVKLVGTSQDITERKQAEDELRQSEERFQLVARATNDAVWDWDLPTDHLWWNHGIYTLFKYRPDEVGDTVQWWSDRIHPDDMDRVVASIHGVMDRGVQFWSDEYRFRRSDGSYADVFDRGFVVYDSERKPVRMIGAITDISERKRYMEILEQRVAARTAELQMKNLQLEKEIGNRLRTEELLLAKNEDLKAFAYTVSHDLKAPLRGIAGYAQELDQRHRQGLDERALFCVEQIRSASRNLDQLIEDLLDYSRLDAETPTVSEVDVPDMIAGILAECAPQIREFGAEVTLDVPAARIRTWERGVRQILKNLFDNALKYSRVGKPPRVHIASRETPDLFQITVADNGIGFDMKHHDRIFGLFNRLVGQEAFEGTGAGLAIAKKAAEKLGGRIRAESKPDEGAKFIFELPKHPSAGGG